MLPDCKRIVCPVAIIASDSSYSLAVIKAGYRLDGPTQATLQNPLAFSTLCIMHNHYLRYYRNAYWTTSCSLIDSLGIQITCKCRKVRLGFVEFMYQKCNKFTLASAGMYVLTQWREHVETDSVYYYVSNQDLFATPLEGQVLI